MLDSMGFFFCCWHFIIRRQLVTLHYNFELSLYRSSLLARNPAVEETGYCLSSKCLENFHKSIYFWFYREYLLSSMFCWENKSSTYSQRNCTQKDYWLNLIIYYYYYYSFYCLVWGMCITLCWSGNVDISML